MNKDNLPGRLGSIQVFLFLLLLSCHAFAQHENNFSKIDVLHYKARIEPDITNGTILGRVNISFLMKEGEERSVKLNCGNLTIDSVYGGNEAISFNVANGLLLLNMDHHISADSVYEVEIRYHGKPTRGIRFFPRLQQVYTVFFAREWLICNDKPNDRATLQLNLIMPKELQVVANGTLSSKTPLIDGKIDYQWDQEMPVPPYVFGFTAGRFNRYTESVDSVKLQYFSGDYTENELSQIFQETRTMVNFFEDRSGIPYPGNTFSQILTEGNVSQEMAAFAVLRNSYGRQVLNNDAEINLSAHELAHQWWGNQITCKNWSHFWLNEGFAVFMSSAYKEHRFGKEEYLKDIDAYFNAYKKVADKGNDKPLVFPDWSNPTADDRLLVYYKGAYVLHLLRNELGEEVFWRALRVYSQSYFGKSVVSADFQKILEKVSGRDLSVFFAKWVY